MHVQLLHENCIDYISTMHARLSHSLQGWRKQNFHWTGNSLIFIFIARDPAYFHVWTSVSVYQTSFILTRRATIATA